STMASGASCRPATASTRCISCTTCTGPSTMVSVPTDSAACAPEPHKTAAATIHESFIRGGCHIYVPQFRPSRPSPVSFMDIQAASRFVDSLWTESIVAEITNYIRIPNKSPHFDPEWREHGHMEAAVALIERWCRAQPIPGLTVEVIRLPNRTPLIF